MKKILIVLCMIVLIVPFSFIGATQAAAQGDNDIEIQLFLGEDQILINGETLSIVKPFVENKTTLVPLRVISEAFGADVNWIQETQTIILNYGDKELELSIGSLTAYVDGEVQELLVEPKLVKNSEVGTTTMVPVRFISENFGADVKYDAETREILITGTLVNSITDLSGINEDAGKTHFGDSYYGWSMKYPAGLVIDFQNFRGDYNNFIDAKGEYELTIMIEEDEDLTQSDLLKELKDYSLRTVLDQQIIHENGQTYAKLVSKNTRGNYLEIRGYIHNSTTFYIFFEVDKEEDYKNEAKYKDYQDLLNSFKLSFASSKEMKDISKVKDGYIQYNNDDYGLSLMLPADWSSYPWTDDLFFANYEKGHYLNIIMSSIKEGDTLDQWVDREAKRMDDTFVEDFTEISEVTNTTITGVPAQERLVSQTYGTQWTQFYDVYFFAGNYKFNVFFEYDKEDYDLIIDSIKHILESITIDVNQLNQSFGYIIDEHDYDQNEKRKIQSNEFKYSIEIPEYWAGYDNDDNSFLAYGSVGTEFEMYATQNLSYLNLLELIEEALDQMEKISTDFKLISSTTTTISGVSAKKYVFSSKDEDGNSYQTTTYLFHKNEITYLIDIFVMDAVRTPLNVKQMDEVLSSLTIK